MAERGLFSERLKPHALMLWRGRDIPFFEYICALMCVHVLACGLAMQNYQNEKLLRSYSVSRPCVSSSVL
jgi:hypothetical protein